MAAAKDEKLSGDTSGEWTNDEQYLEATNKRSHGADATTYTTQKLPGVTQDMFQIGLLEARVNVAHQGFPNRVFFHAGKFDIDLRFLPQTHAAAKAFFDQNGFAIIQIADEKTKLLFNKTIASTGITITTTQNVGGMAVQNTRTVRLPTFIFIRNEANPDPFSMPFKARYCWMNTLACCMCCFPCQIGAYCYGKSQMIDCSDSESAKLCKYFQQLL